MTLDLAGHADLERALTTVRDAFAAALADGARFDLGGAALRADQVRGIASIPGGDVAWTQRGGRWLIRNDTLQGRALLAYGVGTGRYLSAADFLEILRRLAAGDVDGLREPDVAQVVNMVAAEPRHDPRSELPIWATAAWRLASGRDTAYFSQDVPELLTSYDPLYEEIAPGVQLAEGLLPQAVRPLEPTLERYAARLRSEAGTELQTYVQQHLLSRL